MFQVQINRKPRGKYATVLTTPYDPRVGDLHVLYPDAANIRVVTPEGKVSPVPVPVEPTFSSLRLDQI